MYVVAVWVKRWDFKYPIGIFKGDAEKMRRKERKVKRKCPETGTAVWVKKVNGQLNFRTKGVMFSAYFFFGFLRWEPG